MSDELIEFWMGHAIGATKDAYLNMPTEELRELYMDAEKYLVLEKTSRDEKAELEKSKFEISAEIELKIKGLEETVSALQNKVGEQKTTIDDLSRTLNQKMEKIARHVFEDLPGEIEEMKQAQQEFIWKQIQEKEKTKARAEKEE